MLIARISALLENKTRKLFNTFKGEGSCTNHFGVLGCGMEEADFRREWSLGQWARPLHSRSDWFPVAARYRTAQLTFWLVLGLCVLRLNSVLNCSKWYAVKVKNQHKGWRRLLIKTEGQNLGLILAFSLLRLNDSNYDT